MSCALEQLAVSLSHVSHTMSRLFFEATLLREPSNQRNTHHFGGSRPPPYFKTPHIGQPGTSQFQALASCFLFWTPWAFFWPLTGSQTRGGGSNLGISLGNTKKKLAIVTNHEIWGVKWGATKKERHKPSWPWVKIPYPNPH